MKDQIIGALHKLEIEIEEKFDHISREDINFVMNPINKNIISQLSMEQPDFLFNYNNGFVKFRGITIRYDMLLDVKEIHVTNVLYKTKFI